MKVLQTVTEVTGEGFESLIGETSSDTGKDKQILLDRFDAAIAEELAKDVELSTAPAVQPIQAPKIETA